MFYYGHGSAHNLIESITFPHPSHGPLTPSSLASVQFNLQICNTNLSIYTGKISCFSPTLTVPPSRLTDQGQACGGLCIDWVLSLQKLVQGLACKARHDSVKQIPRVDISGRLHRWLLFWDLVSDSRIILGLRNTTWAILL